MKRMNKMLNEYFVEFCRVSKMFHKHIDTFLVNLYNYHRGGNYEENIFGYINVFYVIWMFAY